MTICTRYLIHNISHKNKTYNNFYTKSTYDRSLSLNLSAVLNAPTFCTTLSRCSFANAHTWTYEEKKTIKNAEWQAIAHIRKRIWRCWWTMIYIYIINDIRKTNWSLKIKMISHTNSIDVPGFALQLVVCIQYTHNVWHFLPSFCYYFFF